MLEILTTTPEISMVVPVEISKWNEFQNCTSLGQPFRHWSQGYLDLKQGYLGKAKTKRLALAAGKKTRKSSVLKKLPTMQVLFLKKRFYYDPKSKTIKPLTQA